MMEIEFFHGPHEIHGVGAFQLLKKHLQLLPESNRSR